MGLAATIGIKRTRVLNMRLSQFSKVKMIAVSIIIAVVTPAIPANASGNQPKTLQGAISAAKAITHEKCVSLNGSQHSASKGIVLLGFGCQGGYVQAWAYTGSVWRPLSVGMQNTLIYPLVIPAKMYVCRGEHYTNIRSAPSSVASVLGKVTKNTLVTTTQVKLETSATSDTDGLAWFRITFQGRPAWVSSKRIAAAKDDMGYSLGCGHWTSGKVPGY
jgi:hypothetical protein